MQVSYKLESLTKIAEYIIDCETGEYENYVTFCDENQLEPKDIQGEMQRTHVYALALIGLGLDFPTD